MKLKLAFRAFPDGDVIAIFLNDVCDPNGNWTSYQRVGQHGPCSPDLVHELDEVTPEEYAPLLSELRSIYKPVRVTKSGIPGDAVVFHGVVDGDV